ncbi:hypothetical protein L6452_14879 [Arctium lappa]|uniref:Uncharacterized protein n=1 Tax=Arctium lappa TaxID=4217 RepID=A0ACB9CM38_ARCLA|nr:hypothetical protein L6452_14879 [Arctium lappa]
MNTYMDIFKGEPIQFKEIYADFLRVRAKSKRAVYSHFKITQLREVKMKKFKKSYEFPEFKVTREDEKFYSFTEAYLPNINAYDLCDLYILLIPRDDRDFKYRKVLCSVKEAMKRTIIRGSKEDFQVALDMGVDRVNLISKD